MALHQESPAVPAQRELGSLAGIMIMASLVIAIGGFFWLLDHDHARDQRQALAKLQAEQVVKQAAANACQTSADVTKCLLEVTGQLSSEQRLQLTAIQAEATTRSAAIDQQRHSDNINACYRLVETPNGSVGDVSACLNHNYVVR